MVESLQSDPMCSSSPSSRMVRSMFKTDPFHSNSSIRTPTPIPTPSPRRLSGTSPYIFARVGYRSFVSPMSSFADVNHSTPNPTAKTVRVVVKGRVQGVFYRNWTVENAKELGLRGWVRNRRDGSVEALLSGSPDKVQEMEQLCRRGPPAAMVTGFEVSPCSDDPGTGFERRQTV